MQSSRLFSLTSLLLKVTSVACVGLMAVLTLAIGALLLMGMGIAPNPIPASAIPGVDMGLLLQAGVMVLVACVLCVGLVALILMLIGRIVDTARAGDPFLAENGARLNRIGILLLALQAIG